jgi:hypothetical protein
MMTYIIENIHILNNGQLNRTSLIVEMGRISYKNQAVSRYNFMRMNGDSFIMTPTHVILDSQIPFHQSYQLQKEYYMEQFINKGCTTLLTYVEIQYESELQQKINQFEKYLLNCPIDYVMGVQIPLRLLTPSFIRECKKRKIPAIFVKIEQGEALNQISWGWIKQALFPYNSVLIPIFANKTIEEQGKIIWNQIMSKEKISCITEELKEHQPISKNILAKVGIFPIKASLFQGSEVSYNLYQWDHTYIGGNDEEFYKANENKLLVTVHKDKVIRAGEKMYFILENGEYVKIKVPSFFSFNDETSKSKKYLNFKLFK